MNNIFHNNIKTLIISFIVFFVSLSPVSAEIYNWAYTGSKLIEKTIISSREIADGAIKSRYYFINASGWGHPSCTTAKYAFIDSSALGAKEMLGSMLAAKASGSNVKFIADCLDSSSDYIMFEYVEIE